jgi:hypothetical protein
MFAVFESMEEFEQWHDLVRLKLNYPLLGHNQATNEPDEEILITNFTSPRTAFGQDEVVAFVGDEIDGLLIIDPSDPDWLDWFPVENLI